MKETNKRIIDKIILLVEDGELENNEEITKLQDEIDRRISTCNHKTEGYYDGIAGAEIEECVLCGMQKITWDDGGTYIQCCDYNYRNYG